MTASPMLRVLHIALLLGVMLGLTLPKTSAALADIGLIDDGFVVICTGHGLERVSLAQIDPRPQPPSDQHEAHCLLVHALDHATPADQPLWLRIARSFPRLDAAPPALPSHPPLLAQARAPPAG